MTLSALGKLRLLALATAVRDRQPLCRWEGWQPARQGCRGCVLLPAPGKGATQCQEPGIVHLAAEGGLAGVAEAAGEEDARPVTGMEHGSVFLNGCEWAASTAEAFPRGLPVKKSVLWM